MVDAEQGDECALQCKYGRSGFSAHVGRRGTQRPRPRPTAHTTPTATALPPQPWTGISGTLVQRMRRDFLCNLLPEISIYVLSSIGQSTSLLRTRCVSRHWNQLTATAFGNSSLPNITTPASPCRLPHVTRQALFRYSRVPREHTARRSCSPTQPCVFTLLSPFTPTDFARSLSICYWHAGGTLSHTTPTSPHSGHPHPYPIPSIGSCDTTPPSRLTPLGFRFVNRRIHHTS